MKTILIFPFDLLAHYLRCLVLADQYDKKEYKILFLQSSNYDKQVKERGYDVFSCRQFEADYVMECARKFDFSWLNAIDLERITLDQVSAIKKYNATIIIGDVAPTLKMAAEITSVRYVSLINGYMSKYYAHTRSLSKNHTAYKFLKILPSLALNGITDLAEKIMMRQVHAPFKLIRKKYALTLVRDYLSEIEGDENIICDYEHLFPQKQLPDTYKFIGPLIYEPDQQESLWLSLITDENPVICVCMGSTGDWDKLAFLNDSYYSRYTIITAGDKDKILNAPHVISRDFVNLNKVLKKADLMICHGGNGTIYNGIVNGVFMLCLPSHFEQEWNISAIQRNGYGKSAYQMDRLQWKVEINKAVEFSNRFKTINFSDSLRNCNP